MNIIKTISLNLENKEIIGEGSIGIVYKINYKEEIYSLKKFKKKIENFEDYYLIIEIIKKLINLNHLTLNKIEFISLPQNDNFIFLFYPFHEFTLDQILELDKKGKSPIWYDNTIKILFLIEIAFGMNYLHQNNIIHKCLKPSNILIDNNYNIKINDFGQYLILNSNKDQNNSKIFHSYAYIAPEIINNKDYDNSIDIYSYGLIAYEIITGNDSFSIYSDVWDKKTILNISNENSSLLEIFMNCWSSNPKDRPSFQEIINKLISFNYSFPKLDKIKLKNRIEELTNNLIPKKEIINKKTLENINNLEEENKNLRLLINNQIEKQNKLEEEILNLKNYINTQISNPIKKPRDLYEDIFLACKEGHLYSVIYWVWTRPGIINSKDEIHEKNGWRKKNHTPLHYGCIFGQFEICDFLLRNGADPNLKSNGFFIKIY